MKARVYTYKNCDTCRKAVKWLKAQEIEFDEIPIREQPPSKAELGKMLTNQGGDLRKLFNTSGLDYKALNMKEKLPGMNEQQAIDLLAKSGNLVKRPFLLKGEKGVVGFKQEEWESFFG